MKQKINQDRDSTIYTNHHSHQTLGLFINSTFIGFLTNVPTLSISQTYSAGSVNQLLDGLQTITTGMLNVLDDAISAPDLPFVNQAGNTAKIADSIMKEAPNILGGHLKMQGIRMDGGVMSRQTFQTGQTNGYPTYTFNTTVSGFSYLKALQALKNNILPSYSGKDAPQLNDIASILMSPSMFLSPTGELLTDTMVGKMWDLAKDEFGKIVKTDGSNPYIDDTFNSGKKGGTATIIDSFTALVNDETTSNNESGRRMAFFYLRRVSDDKLLAEIEAGKIKLTSANPLREANKLAESRGLDGFFTDTINAVSRFIGTISSIGSAPLDLILYTYQKSLITAPRRMDMDDIVVCRVDGYGSPIDVNGNATTRKENLWSQIVPTPKKDDTPINRGLKMSMTNLTITPSQNIDEFGAPISYNISISVQASQVVTQSSMFITPQASDHKEQTLVGGTNLNVSNPRMGQDSLFNNLDLANFNEAINRGIRK